MHNKIWEKLYRNRTWFVYLPLTAYWLFIFIMTSIPAKSMPTIGVWDKFEHTGAYLVLSVLLYLTLSFQRSYNLLKKFPGVSVIIIATFYAAADEIHQMLIPGRYCDIIDWLADLSGIVLGVLICSLFIGKRIRTI